MSYNSSLTDAQIRATPLAVSGNVTLAAGTAAIGKLAANSGVIIGAVELAAAQTLGTVTTVATVTNLAQMGGSAIAMGTGVRSAGTQRVTIATDDLVPISAASLPLPTGAATAAKQPALGTAGTASTDVITVQGIAGGVAQPVSGTFFQATQPVSIAASVAVTGTFWQATQPVSLASTTVTGTVAISAASLPLPTGAATETTLAALNTKVTAVNTGAVTISAALPTGTNAIGSVSSVDTTSTGTITAISQNVALALNGKSGAAIQITGTWVGTLQFEGTVDGTNWVAVNGVYAGASTPATTITANGLVRLTPSGLAQLRITSTAWTSGTATITMRGSDATGGTFLNQSLTAGTNVIGKVGIDQTTPGTTNLVSIGTNGTVALNAAIPAGANTIGAVNIAAAQTLATVTTVSTVTNLAQLGGAAVAMGSGVTGTGVQRVVLATDVALPPAAAAAATYSASIVALATAVTATDIFTITGSATKTVRVSKILINGVQTTAAQINVLVIKRSTANTAGTSTAPTRVPYDSASAAATATVLAYTANPTLGTAVGTGSAIRVFVPGAATASDAQGLVIISGDVGQQMMTLRGVAEVLAVNLNSTTITGSAINVTVEWTET